MKNGPPEVITSVERRRHWGLAEEHWRARRRQSITLRILVDRLARRVVLSRPIRILPRDGALFGARLSPHNPWADFKVTCASAGEPTSTARSFRPVLLIDAASVRPLFFRYAINLFTRCQVSGKDHSCGNRQRYERRLPR